jgi:hypothetical protein
MLGAGRGRWSACESWAAETRARLRVAGSSPVGPPRGFSCDHVGKLVTTLDRFNPPRSASPRPPTCRPRRRAPFLLQSAPAHRSIALPRPHGARSPLLPAAPRPSARAAADHGAAARLAARPAARPGPPRRRLLPAAATRAARLLVRRPPARARRAARRRRREQGLPARLPAPRTGRRDAARQPQAQGRRRRRAVRTRHCRARTRRRRRRPQAPDRGRGQPEAHTRTPPRDADRRRPRALLDVARPARRGQLGAAGRCRGRAPPRRARRRRLLPRPRLPRRGRAPVRLHAPRPARARAAPRRARRSLIPPPRRSGRDRPAPRD